MVDVMPLVDEGLSNSAYLVDLGDGRALAVDPTRDLRALRALAERRGLRIAFAADTHLHADFLTGAVELAASDGAQVLASAAGNREFRHTALGDGDEVDLGGLTLRTLSTPGHTQEHVAYELLDGPSTCGVFTGGSLLVGAAARTDLVAPELTEQLARAGTARCSGWPGWTTTSRCGRLTVRARSAPPRRGPSGRRQSAVRRRRTRCCARRPRTRLSTLC